MTQSRLRAWLALAIWLICGTIFAITVFSDGGPATYGEQSARRVIGAAALALGLIGTPLMRLFTRKFPGGSPVVRDERDDRIEAKGVTAGLIVVVMAVFCLNLGLWEAHQDTGTVPVGWMWVTAYGTLILSHIVPAAASLFVDYRGLADGC